VNVPGYQSVLNVVTKCVDGYYSVMFSPCLKCPAGHACPSTD
jgi:hypothetical protein